MFLIGVFSCWPFSVILLDSLDEPLKTAFTGAITDMTAANPALSVSPQFVMVDNQLEDSQRRDFGQ